MGGVLKPLITFNSKPLIERIVEATKGSNSIYRVFVAITPESDQIKDAVQAEFIETAGYGYVEDMVAAVNALALKKTLVLSADLPLLTSVDLDWVVEEYRRLGTPALAVFVPSEFYRELGLEPGLEMNGLVPAGVNIIDGENLDGEESNIVTENPHFAFNINTQNDLERALEFAGKASRE
jgi:GTP:adenosylcobinamide-phosphate guanylyltransferase